jgi:hypothetical protein
MREGRWRGRRERGKGGRERDVERRREQGLGSYVLGVDGDPSVEGIW